MIPVAAPCAPVAAPADPPPLVRRARPQDAPALHELSSAFVRSGALRPRGIDHYLAHAGEFILLAGRDHGRAPVRGCLALSDAGDGAGILYNFCVARESQGRGLGAALLHAAFAEARSRRLRALFTATTSGAALFRRHGFVPAGPGRAPAAWAGALDPARGSEVLTRRV